MDANGSFREIGPPGGVSAANRAVALGERSGLAFDFKADGTAVTGSVEH
jgi:hypothetical protein